MHNYYGPTNTAKMAEINESAEIWASCFTDVSAIGVCVLYRRKPHCFRVSRILFTFPEGKKRPLALASALVCCGCCNNTLPMEWPGTTETALGSKSPTSSVLVDLHVFPASHLVSTRPSLCSHCILPGSAIPAIQTPFSTHRHQSLDQDPPSCFLLSNLITSVKT